MKLYFVGAADGKKLTKKFVKIGATDFKKFSYPNVTRVNSIVVDTDGSPEAFFQALKLCADDGLCLLTGALDKQLNDESRAGHKLKDQQSDWVMFDVDGLDGVDDIEEFINIFLPPEFHCVSYVAQHSASSGIVGSGLRAHIFFMLNPAIDPTQIKLWLEEHNLDFPSLRKQLKLGAGGGSLIYPLDRIANDHGRVVFITPPECEGFDDPMTERITLVTKSLSHSTFQFKSSSNKVIRGKTLKVIMELRDTAGLDYKKLQIKFRSGFEVLMNADPIQVDSWWEAGGYIHMNVNGGDSGAYWVNPKYPRYIQNFKGEPVLVLREVAATFWEEIQGLCMHPEMLLFRDRLTDTHYAGRYDPAEDKIEYLDTINKQNIKAFAMVRFGIDADLDMLPQLDYVFEPGNSKTVDRALNFVNRFDPTDYMRLPIEKEVTYTLPPTIAKFLLHMCGGDAEVMEWMQNREAVIFQKRKKSQTAMVMQGVPGMGKGFYFQHITKPLYGDYAQSIQLGDNQEKDMFTSFLTKSLVLHVEESKASPALRDRIFHWIADDDISIRGMHKELAQIRTYCNFTFVSNHFDAVQIETDDRRYTVAPYQKQRLLDAFTNEELDGLIPAELSQYARYLLTREADVELARISLSNEAKEYMRESSMTTSDLFVHALKEGDLDWFIRAYLEGMETQHQHGMAVNRMFKQWLPTINRERTPVFKSDLFQLYLFITDLQRTNEMQFGKMLVARGYAIRADERVKIDGKRRSGVWLRWKASDDMLAELEDSLGEKQPAPIVTTTVTDIKDINGHSE